MRAKGIILCILSSISFGLAFSIAPLTYGDAGSNAVNLALFRNFLALPFLFFIIIFLKIGFKITLKQFFNLVLIGVLGNSTTALMLNLALVHIDVGIVMPIHFTYPLFVLLFSVLFYKDKLSKSNIIALIIAMIGILCFFYEALANLNANSKEIIIGLILALLTGATYGFYIIFMDKSGLKTQNPFKMTFYISLASGFSVLTYGLIFDEFDFSKMTQNAWLFSLAFALLCNVIALSLLQIGIKHIGANMAAVITTFEPLTGVICGAWFLGELITIGKIIACCFIFAGVLILSFYEK